VTAWAERQRLASVILVDRRERVLGELPAVALSEPWLQEIAELVDHVNTAHEISIAILRLLQVDDSEPGPIRAQYLAELSRGDPGRLPLQPWHGELTPEPLRQSYASAGGPQSDLDWAAAELERQGFGQLIQCRQIRTWNLSSIWQLHTENETFWLKSVPSFFAHEGRVLSLLQSEAVPRLIAHDNQRVLMGHQAGEDCYDADLPLMRKMVTALVELQWRWRTRTAELKRAGIQDHSGMLLCESVTDVINRHLDELTPGEQSILANFRDTLPDRIKALWAAGIPSTLVHGDYHPGNWRGNSSHTIILDWGDCFIGHPLQDLPALLDRAGDDADELREHWIKEWQSHCPEADMEHALDLVTPLARARMAAVYQMFLDNIEPTERIYHEDDPLSCLCQVIESLASTA